MTSILREEANFMMYGAREIIERAGGAIQIHQQVEAIETAIEGMPAMVFDLSKALVETTCKTILNEIGESFDNNDDLPQLLKKTLTQLRLFPSGHESPNEITESIKKTVNGLMTTVQGLCNLRTREGMSGHGRDAYSQNLESIQAKLAASAADTVMSFLWNAHQSYSPETEIERLSSEEKTEFNEWIDQTHEPPVTIFSQSYNQSDILFRMDRPAYINALKDYKENLKGNEEIDEVMGDSDSINEIDESEE